ncbi:aspartate decarboxylase-like fold harboring protein [Alicycliphilus sp. B1]|nr:aspartate decarboxylase-like fold harboring protein [Alicycliphilus sp. B1]
MTDLDAEDQPSAPWAVSAAYFYTLDLDGPALAWEYLRRHPQYRADWARRRFVSFGRWGLRKHRGPAPRCARSAPRLDRDR